ncbi:MoaD/ThiS family protein [Candidatus Bathyarchaeota archaeon]|nr:MoaD/ThiS family protein [Candidatus Bathyarchaeota archaeon]
MREVAAKIVLFATLRKKFGVRELEVKCDGTVRSLIEKASMNLGKDFFDMIYDVNRDKVRDGFIFTINGRNIRDIKKEVRIRDGDVIAIFPQIAGG